MAAVEFEDPAGDVVEEVAVVGDRDHRALVLLQEPFQPGDRFGVQVIGRFVQEQHVRFRQQQAAERDAPSLATGQVLHRRAPLRQAQGVGRDVERAIEIVAIDRGQEGLEFGLFGRQLVKVGVFIRVGGVDRFQAGECVLDGLDPFLDDVAHRVLGIEVRLLFEEADLDAGLRTGLALDLGIAARHDAQQRTLARAVQAEHADLGAGEERQGNVAKDRPLRRNDLRNPVHRVDKLRHGNLE